MAKNSSGNAFILSKKKVKDLLQARENGVDIDATLNYRDIFELQHHHLLSCLENATVSDRLDTGVT